MLKVLVKPVEKLMDSDNETRQLFAIIVNRKIATRQQ